MLTFALIALVLLALLLRQNLIVILGSALIFLQLFISGDPLRFIILDAWQALNQDVLLSIPLFILAGQIMSRGSMAERMVSFVRAVTGPVPGGLAIATVLSCALFAAISGSSTVTLLAVGGVMYPALLSAGYSRSFALGALCAAGTLGIIVPPSIPLILYGVMTNTSITDLFIAGIGPAAVLTLLMAAYAMWYNRDKRESSWSLTEIRTSFVAGIWSLAMPVLILGGIYSGHFTATESAAVAVVYALLVEMLIHRELDASAVFEVVGGTTRLLGSLFPILIFAVGLNVFFTYEQVPAQMVAWVTETIDSQTGFIIASNLFLLLAGTVMDIGSAVLVLSPILAPVASAQGMDLTHFGIMMIVNLEIGYLTPPFGLNLIVAMGAFNENFSTIVRSVLPFLVLMLIGLLTVSFIPRLSLFLLD